MVMPTQSDSQDRLIHTALRTGRLDAQKVRKGFQLLRAARKVDGRVSLGQILVENRLLTRDQLSEIRRVMDSEGRLPRLGEFEVLSRIGRGAMGTVYRARQMGIDRIVALKVLASHLAANDDFVRRFLREARLAARMNHANVVRVYDIGRSAGIHYIAMEYVPGRSIEQDTRAGRLLSETRAASIAVQIAEGLNHAAACDIVHRDIKPGNIIVTSAGVAKLADLGLAVATGDESEGNVGTPFYMSPEQARNDPDLDIRSDIYSLGCTLFHAVTGRVPYAGTTAFETLRLHAEAPVINARTIRPDLSPEFAAVLQKMMAKRPEDRFPSPEALINAMKSAAHVHGGASKRSDAGRRRWWLIPVVAAVVLLVILIIVTAAIAIARRNAQPPPERRTPWRRPRGRRFREGITPGRLLSPMTPRARRHSRAGGLRGPKAGQ